MQSLQVRFQGLRNEVIERLHDSVCLRVCETERRADGGHNCLAWDRREEIGDEIGLLVNGHLCGLSVRSSLSATAAPGKGERRIA